VRLLLDTHVFLWWIEDVPRLKRGIRASITGADAVFVSAASAWEIAIKQALGKLRIPPVIEEGIEQSGFSPLPIGFRHAAAVAELPLHHGDPFDRMLIAQARVEGATLVTHDRQFERYGVPVLWT
jgi:PIN domain nuclease of toxin-antitoxin system